MADPCSIEGCTRKRSGRGWCNTHYERWRKHGTTDLPPRKQRPQRPDCTVADCSDESQPSHGMCKRHYKAQWYQRNKERIAAESAGYRRANRDRIRACNRARYEREREDRLAAEARRYLDDPEFARRKKQITAAWRKANPGRARLNARNYSGRRRARIAGQDVTDVQLEAILTQYGMVCHICQEAIADRSDLHFDHVIPVAKGGGHTPENIRPAHAVCNMRKNARLVAC